MIRHLISILGAALAAVLVLDALASAGINFVSEDYARDWQPNMSSMSSHKSMSLDQKFTGLAGLSVSMLRDSRTSMSYSGQWITSTNRQFHMQTDSKARSVLSFDRNTRDYGTGLVTSTQKLGFNSRPTDRLNLSMDLTTLNRNGRAQTSRSLGAAMALSKRLNFSMNTRSTRYGAGNPINSTVYLLEGSLPDRFGVAKNLKFNINKTQGKGVATVVRFDSRVLGGNLACEAADRGYIGWNGPFRKVLDYSTGFGPGRKVKIDLVTKERTAETGITAVVRKRTISCPVGSKSTATAELYTNRETPWGTIDPVRGAEWSLNTSLKKWSLGGTYRNDANIVSGVRHILYGLNATEKTKKGGTVQAGVAMESWSGSTTWLYSLKYDRQVSEDQFVTLRTELRTRNDAAPGTQKSTQVWLDLRRLLW